jgi:enterochelin esterase family protein
LIIVMPNGGNSWYVDSAALGGPGDFASAIDRDLVDMIDREYATDTSRNGRAIAGLSMGGFGALRLALMRPERYGAVAAVSPALWIRVTPETVPDERYDRVFQGSFGRPFDSRRFVAANPMSLIDGVAHSHRRPAIYLAAGNDDYPGIVGDTEAFHHALIAAGLPAELHLVDGRHDWGLWSRQLGPVLRFVDASLGAQAAADH